MPYTYDEWERKVLLRRALTSALRARRHLDLVAPEAPTTQRPSPQLALGLTIALLFWYAAATPVIASASSRGAAGRPSSALGSGVAGAGLVGDCRCWSRGGRDLGTPACWEGCVRGNGGRMLAVRHGGHA
jgi:hypothetical protein